MNLLVSAETACGLKPLFQAIFPMTSSVKTVTLGNVKQNIYKSVVCFSCRFKLIKTVDWFRYADV